MNINLLYIQQQIFLGREAALGDLYHHYHKRLKQFAKTLSRSNELAEEAVEDVFIKLWLRRDKIMQIDNLIVYLYVAVKNTSLNQLADKAKALIDIPFDYLDTDAATSFNNPHELLITGEMMQRMQKAIEQLPPKCKMIFKLVREDGLKYKEVAEILNISVNTIDAQMAIAVKKICTSLSITKQGKSFSFNSPKEKS